MHFGNGLFSMPFTIRILSKIDVSLCEKLLPLAEYIIIFLLSMRAVFCIIWTPFIIFSGPFFCFKFQNFSKSFLIFFPVFFLRSSYCAYKSLTRFCWRLIGQVRLHRSGFGCKWFWLVLLGLGLVFLWLKGLVESRQGYSRIAKHAISSVTTEH